MDAAADLVAASRPDEAIRLLTEANRRTRDPRLEQELVTVRHEAALAHVAEPTSTDPLVRSDDDPGPLPELGPDDLDTETLRRGIARHGCVLVRDFLAPDRVASLVDGIDRTFEAFDAAVDGAPSAETVDWYRPFKPRGKDYRIGGRRNWMRAGGGVWTVDSPRMLFELFEVLEETGTDELVTEYLGERPALSANKCNLRRVPPDTSTNWHQDGAFLGDDVQSLNLWVGLTRCGTDAPGLDILPRRLDEVVETGTEGAIFDWSVGPGVVETLARTTPVIRPELEPGDAMLFDHLFLHRTGVGEGMTRERHAIETWFFAPSAYPEGQIPIAC